MGYNLDKNSFGVVCFLLFFFFFVFVSYSSSKIHTFETPKFQFTFGSLHSPHPRTDGISLQQWEDGETRIRNKYFLTGSFLSTLVFWFIRGSSLHFTT